MGRLSILLLVCVLGLLVLATSASADPGITLTGISPAGARAGTSVECVIQGHFKSGHDAECPRFSLVRGATTIAGRTTSFDESGGKWARATFALPGGSAPGSYDLNATQEVGHRHEVRCTASLPGAFQLLGTAPAPAPIITGISPAGVAAGSGPLTLTLYGSGFAPGANQSRHHAVVRGSVVLWNGAELSTVFISPTELRATIPAAKLARPGSASITVRNVSDGTVSNAVTFTISAVTHAPTITGLSPSSALTGGPAFSLGVIGREFVTGPSGAVVRWNGTDLVTSRDSASHLTAAVPGVLIAAAGSASITVRNGTSPGAPVSNALTFTVVNPVPSVAGITPAQVWAGYVKNDVVLTVSGSNFVYGTHVMLGAVEKPATSFLSAAQVSLPLLAADIAVPGTINVGIKNPAPGGGLSATTKPLAVVPETSDPAVTIGGADTGWHNAPVTLTFSASDGQSGVQTVQYLAPPGVPAWTAGASCTVPVTTQGAITIGVRALDWCNRVGTASATVNIDTTPPTTDALNAVSVKHGRTASLKYRVTEPVGLSPTATVVLTVRATRSGTTVKTVSITAAGVNTTQTASFRVTFKPGSYRWYVHATDLAGNRQANVDSAKFRVR